MQLKKNPALYSQALFENLFTQLVSFAPKLPVKT